MRVSCIVSLIVPLVLAVPAPAVGDDSACACPMPLCPPGQLERCKCQNAAIAACWAQQMKDGKICPAPALKDCDSTDPGFEPTTTRPPMRRSTSLLGTVTALAASASCSCEPTFCPQVWPQSCRCANSAKVRCHQNCEGDVPQLQDCGDTEEQSVSLYGEFASSTASEILPLVTETPESTLSSEISAPTLSEIPELTNSYERPSAVPSLPSEPEPSCECEPAFCVQSWPEGCYCDNRAKLDCIDKCGGPYPELLDCGGRLGSPTSTSDLEDFPQSTDTPIEPSPSPDGSFNAGCQCEPVFCAQSWPLSCQCSNQAASDCAALCGRPAPQYLDCNGPAPSDLQTSLPDLFSMIPDPSDIPVIFTNLISDLPDPQDLPEYLENLPDYVNDIPDDEPWSETHNWFSFIFPGPTPAPESIVPELPETAVLTREERLAALTAEPPSVTSTAAPNYQVCGHRAADPCPTGYECLARPDANCGPEVDCGGYCVDTLHDHTLLANTMTVAPSATLSNTTTMSFTKITDYFPSTLSTSMRLARSPRQVTGAPIPDPTTAPSDEAATTPVLSPQIPCGEGYPPCDPGLQCVDIFVNGIGFAEKRSFCAVVPPSSSSSDTDDIASSTFSAPDLVSPVIVAVSNTPIWPDTAWPGPITTLSPLFGPGPVGMSLRSSSTPIAINPLIAPLPSLAPIPTPLHTPSAIIPSATDSLALPSDTTVAVPLVMHCGGPTNDTCPETMVCVRDLDAPGGLESCGPPCGEVGVCIMPETCGGFTGQQCSQAGRQCVDDPSDDCDPANGGADCMGICV